jgi:GGDEF domain-containing protein
MISIRSELNELERSHQLGEMALDCYVNAIRNVDHYALELDSALTAQFRKHMGVLANDVATERWNVLDDSRATFRALLRDYRDRCSAHLTTLRDELAGTARALEEILDSLNQTDGDHETRLRGAIGNLRKAAGIDPTGTISQIVESAADSIEQSIEQMKKQHQLSVSQFKAEIRVLHQRIDGLEKAASRDQLTQLANRTEMTERIRLSVAGEFCLLLVAARGLLRAEVLHGKEVGEELAAAFAKRLGNCLADDAVAGRWSAEEFIAMVKIKKTEAIALGKWISENLSGAYACLKAGKAVRPSLQASVAVVETSPNETPERILQRIDAFLIRV